MDLSVLFSNLIGLFLLIGAGFFSARSGLLPAEVSKPLSALLIRVAVPATVFRSLLRPYNPEFVKQGGTVLLLGIPLLLLFLALSKALVRVLRVPPDRRGMWRCCATFCNNGFMGFPVALALFGEEGLSLTVILSLPITFMLYSTGVKLVCSDRGGAAAISWSKAVLTPINLAMAAGLAVYFTQLPLPQALQTPIGYLADLTTPLSMIVIGMNLSQGRLSEVARDKDAFTASAVRLILFPLIAWGLMRLIPGLNSLVLGAILINLAMPAPAAASFIGEDYGGCTQLAARTVFLSSLLCIGTIPLIALLL